MYKILTLQGICGEGNQRYAAPPMHEGVHFTTVQEAAQEIVTHYGHGIVVNQEHELELHV